MNLQFFILQQTYRTSLTQIRPFCAFSFSLIVLTHKKCTLLKIFSEWNLNIIYFSFLFFSVQLNSDLVIACPDIYQVALGSDAEFIVLASDGLWDYMSRSKLFRQ